MTIGDTGTFTDPKDGQVYHWKVMKDGKKWMTSNYNFKSPQSVCYDHNDANATEHGRLYLWSEVKNACPPGWRIPSQNEWYKLVWAYNTDDFRAIRDHLMKGKDSGFSITHSGFWAFERGFLGIGEDSVFWTSDKGGWEQGEGKLRWCFAVTNCASCPDVPEKNKYSCRFMADE
ncbi:MAG: hypothetical protein MI974_06845 [Chitinophagales bacterium]|nr:hypothetical protein [Chitinophagales bacterium]